MQPPRVTVRDLCWLVVVASLLLAVVVDRSRHGSEMTRLENEARSTIHGLSFEAYRCTGRTVPAHRFAPVTPLPPRYDWKVDGSLVPEWAEERVPGLALQRTRPAAVRTDQSTESLGAPVR